MNEKIKQLAEQADAYAHLTGEGMMYQKTRERYTEKFAELIVKECAELTSRYQMGTTRLPDIIVSYNYSDKLEDVLKKHFGVKD